MARTLTDESLSNFVCDPWLFKSVTQPSFLPGFGPSISIGVNYNF